jgi:Raf kinase inhibitor-like YbhB/YbcL family protein
VLLLRVIDILFLKGTGDRKCNLAKNVEHHKMKKFEVVFLIFIALTVSFILTRTDPAAAGPYSISPTINNQGQIVWFHVGCQFWIGEEPNTSLYTETGKYLFYQGGNLTPINITTNSDYPGYYFHPPQPLFNDLGQIGYMIEKDGGYKIYFNDGPGSAPQLASGSLSIKYDVQLNQQGQMVWDSYDDNTNLQVYLFNNGQGQGVPITNYTYTGSYTGFSGGLSLNDAGHVVWTDRSYESSDLVQTLRLYKEGTTQSLYSTTNTMFFIQINNQGQVVWLEQDQATGKSNIMLYDGGSAKLIPGGDGFLWGYVTFLQINNRGQVMWLGKKMSDSEEYNIYLYSNGSTTQVTHYANDGSYVGIIDLYENFSDERTKFSPHLNNNGEIVWVTRVPNGSNPAYYDLTVQVYSAGQITQLDHWTANTMTPAFSTDAAMHAAYAQINDAGQVTWSRYNGAFVPDLNSDFEIYLATPVTFAITSTAGPNGTVSPSATVNYGRSSTFTITPNSGYHVTDVLVDGVSVGAVTTYTFDNVIAAHTISVNFAINTYTITVTVSGSGKIISKAGDIDCAKSCQKTYDFNTPVILTALPDVPKVFFGWSGDCTGTNVCSLTMNGNKNVTATFGILGDVNNDGNLDLTDAIIGLQVLIGIKPSLSQTIYSGADVNGDGKIGLAEVIYVLQKVAGIRQDTSPGGTFTLTSTAFTEGAIIPTRYTYNLAGQCAGENVSPALAWTNSPANTQSFAIIMHDPDGGNWVHWVQFNISAGMTSLAEAAGGADVGVKGLNDFGGLGYGGPCPPSGNHRYIFTLYALDVALNLTQGATRGQVNTAIAGHILGQVTLTGLRSYGN